jgi:hypothetical protein
MVSKVILSFALICAAVLSGCQSRSAVAGPDPEGGGYADQTSAAPQPQRRYSLISSRAIPRRVESGILGGHDKVYRADDGTEAQMRQVFYFADGAADSQLEFDANQALQAGYSKAADKPWQDRHGKIGRVVLLSNGQAEMAILAHEKLYVGVISPPGYASQVMEIYLDSPAFSQSLPVRPVAPAATADEHALHDSEPEERMCYRCNGTGQIGPFGNPYGDYGYKPAEECPNCHGTGRVQR